MNKIKQLPKETWIGFFASFTEAYNMSLIPFLIPYLSKVIFKDQSLLSIYSFLSISPIVFHPLGGIFFGLMGDKIGRKWSCTWSTFGLGLSTILIAFIPNEPEFAYLGLLFLIANCLQYFFSGGEYYSVIIYSLEHAKGEEKNYVSGLSCFFAVIGLIIAYFLCSLSNSKIYNFNYKSCFIIGGLISLICFFIKYYCQESPDFKIEISHNITNYVNFSIKLLQSFFIMGLFATFYAYIFIFLPTQSPQLNESSQLISLTIYGFALLFFGFIADIVGNIKIMSLGIILFIFVLIIMIPNFDKYFIITQALLTFSASLFIGPMHFWNIKQFVPNERCRGLLIGGGIGASFFFGISTPICILLTNHFNGLNGTLIFILPLSLIALLVLNKKKFN